MVAYLIHWKATKTRLDGSRCTPLTVAKKARDKARTPKEKAKFEEIIKRAALTLPRPNDCGASCRTHA